jgi:periplasmic divalent cation tolerance protein
MSQAVIVLVTCCSLAEAKRIARAVVMDRLAACVNILPGSVASIYRWKGKVETAQERLLLMKTSRGRLPSLQRAVKRLHSYDLPEFLALSIQSGSQGYLRWLSDSVAPPRRSRLR